MSGVIATIPKYQFLATDGTPLAAGTLTTYLAGTTTLSNTWQDSALTSANTNPITLDSRGECVLWLDSTKSYKFLLKNSAGVTQWTVDNINNNNNTFTTLQVSQPSATATDVGTLKVSRIANYSGGTAGFVNSAIRADVSVGSGATAYEWAVTGVMDNSATAGENVGGYFQGKKNSTGPTWGAVAEVMETTAVNNPATGTVGLEVDVGCNGTDSAGVRVGVDLVLRRYAAGGADAKAGWGYRIQNGGYSGSVVDRGFGFAAGTQVNKAFDASTATTLTAAFQMETNQVMAFNTAGSRQMTHNGSGWVFKNPTGPINYWSLNDDRSLVVQGTQILGGRCGGWTAATGTATRTTFVTSTVTLPVLAEHVKALIDDLTLHGLIGA